MWLGRQGLVAGGLKVAGDAEHGRAGSLPGSWCWQGVVISCRVATSWDQGRRLSMACGWIGCSRTAQYMDTNTKLE